LDTKGSAPKYLILTDEAFCPTIWALQKQADEKKTENQAFKLKKMGIAGIFIL
jgi:hypothetical protein